MANEKPLSDETVRSLQELGEAFRRIHRRLVSEGWLIKDGVFTPPPGYQPPKQPRPWKQKSE